MNLALADFRFLSAWVQGIDVREAWDRYCSHRGPSDLRRIRTSVYPGWSLVEWRSRQSV